MESEAHKWTKREMYKVAREEAALSVTPAKWIVFECLHDEWRRHTFFHKVLTDERDMDIMLESWNTLRDDKISSIVGL
ncbi:hypothetical protein H5410_022462 [Solanum commersonii]|uniref:Uncharacterized protein n=1 Tax=Solanum commersonii TaxID=4109 RepID=A0A9J5ZFI1_SOLCO|nr:hypothetical protein H5410_022462 [Solanum commersonii]